MLLIDPNTYFLLWWIDCSNVPNLIMSLCILTDSGLGHWNPFSQWDSKKCDKSTLEKYSLALGLALLLLWETCSDESKSGPACCKKLPPNYWFKMIELYSLTNCGGQESKISCTGLKSTC